MVRYWIKNLCEIPINVVNSSTQCECLWHLLIHSITTWTLGLSFSGISSWCSRVQFQWRNSSPPLTEDFIYLFSLSCSSSCLDSTVFIKYSPAGVFLIYMAHWCCRCLLLTVSSAALENSWCLNRVTETRTRVVPLCIISLIALFCLMKKRVS